MQRIERGATTVEYGLMIAAVAVLLMLALGGMTEALDDAWDKMIGGIT